jgi:succinoglycan biosynthesis transport protein ExoP
MSSQRVSRTPPTVLSASDDIFKIMWRSRWLVLLSVLAAAAAGFTYIRMVTPAYTSTAKLYVQQSSPPFLRMDYGEPQRYNLYTQAAMLRSTRILSAALGVPEFRNMQTFAGMDNPLAYLEASVQVAVGKNDDVLSISFSSPYAAEASGIVNGIVDAFMADHEENNRKTSAEILDGLERERDRKKEDLDRKRAALADLRKKNALLAMELDQGGVARQELQRLSAALGQARMNTVEAATWYEGVKDRAEDPNGLREYLSLSAPPGLYDASAGRRVTLSQRLFELGLSRRGLLNDDLTGNHPEVKAVRDEMEQTRIELARLDDQFVRAQLAAAEQHYLDVKTKEERVARLFEEQRQQVLALNDQMVDYQLLASEVNELAEYLKTLQQQIRELSVNEDLELDPSKIRVMEVARPAASPSRPQKSKALAVALVLGLVLGGGLAVARDWLDQTLRSAEDITVSLGLPVLGVVPAMSRRQGPRVSGRIVFLKPESQEAEALRTVRTAVFFGAPKEKARTLLITSPSAGDGKSTLVSNLAIAIARAGQKTIVVDADFRKPSQHTVFGVNHQEQCLTRVFAGQIRLAEAIIPTDVKGLSLLTCGPGISNPAETINSRKFATLLQYLSRVYDRVLIDAPPVTLVTDAQILGALCDFTILVLRVDKCSRKMAHRSIDALQGVGARLLGVVINGVRGSDTRYGCYGGYQQRPRPRHAGPGGNRMRRHVQIGAGVRQPVAGLISGNG